MQSPTYRHDWIKSLVWKVSTRNSVSTTVLDKAIGLESKHKELSEHNRMFQSHGQYSNTHPSYHSSQVFQDCLGGQGGN